MYLVGCPHLYINNKTMENKQTAVEWLVRMLYSPICVGFIQNRRQIPHHIIEQAKQMEKEQIKKAYKIGVAWGHNNMEEYYYNENYGKENSN